jgi:methylmalonyl-CoA/ethylmalonyl-CoA epimerase
MVKSRELKSTFSQLIQVGLVVKDLNKTVQRLESMGIGPFKANKPEVVEKSLFRGKPLDPNFKQLSTKIGDIELEIFEPGEQTSPWKEFLDRKGEGIHHIAFYSIDPLKEAEKFKGKGVDVFLGSKDVKGRSGVYLDLNISDIIFELTNY